VLQGAYTKLKIYFGLSDARKSEHYSVIPFINFYFSQFHIIACMVSQMDESNAVGEMPEKCMKCFKLTTFWNGLNEGLVCSAGAKYEKYRGPSSPTSDA